ncbi:protein-methionine-sulfoxide reductase catalytic subunit MsrP [Chitinivorax sp. B]|uniref:protein-methionine-sulfoxide reductase catalytic subunit MsrP n=1 Tax=Chitinivorax sp. B TaxID=2502235 RepID=UPI0010F8ECDB|nr:protein-methionine-sulfoxide reductase catalytic subunit MsrP [Chitinivorax sp. B]
MLIRHPTDILPSEITDKALYLSRRDFMTAAGAAGLVLAGVSGPVEAKLATVPSRFSTADKPNTKQEITTYNNFYEFGTDKGDPAVNAGKLVTRPWTVRVEGEVMKPKTFDLDEIMKLAPLEERIYRLRCVEGWSMVIPWIGYSLSEILKRVEPTSKAKYVEFTTLKRPEQMPGQRNAVLDWPYVEGLRIDEAMNPLTLVTLGLYGELLPNQNGAPIRIAVPWKYGFKSAKSVIRIRLVEKQPISSWMSANPREYGFFSNVNPQVDHPRWSQASERRIGEFFKRKTVMFNGYGDQVASMYAGMDLKKYF